jgi:hypothetical protein
MADAEDLKSSGDFSSCGFDSHPGHHSFLLKLNEFLESSLSMYLALRKYESVPTPNSRRRR